MDKKEFAVIAIITFTVFVSWLVFDIIHNSKASTPLSPNLQQNLGAVNPNFDQETLEKIKQTKPITVVTNQIPGEVIPSPMVTPQPKPSLPPISQPIVATQSASFSENNL